jgi:DNA-binding transcriptional MocR family regulator
LSDTEVRPESPARRTADFLYKGIARDIEGKIRRGEFRAGDKLPSLRRLHRRLGLSLATVYQAYIDLETSGLIESRPRSGFFVKAAQVIDRPAPRHSRRTTSPRPVRLAAITAEVIDASLDPGLIPLGASTLSPDLSPYRHLTRLIKTIPVTEAKALLNYAPAEGEPELRRQVARRLVGLLPGVGAEDVLITSGCMEAVSLALRAVVGPGQVVAVESPTHFGFLQLLRELGLKVVSVPTDPRLGLDPEGLAQVLDKHRPQALLTTANFQNPLGALIPEARKREIVELTNRRGLPVIEDDIYGDMHFGPRRPGLLKGHDRRDLVITCSSVSKVLAPGFRIGWCLPGERFGPAVRRLKVATTMSSPTLAQRVLSRFMSGGAFDRHLRSLRVRVQRQVIDTARAVERLFPKRTRLALPQGGNLLWLELPGRVDGVELYRRARRAGVSIVPGRAFTPGPGFDHYIRLSCTTPFDERIERGVKILGRLVRDLAE